MKKPLVAQHEVSHGTVRSYSTGFGLSLALTIASYLAASHHWATGWALVVALTALALSQLIVQLIFFLHLGRESRPRWNLNVLLFAAMVVIILVFGSLWIMKNLEYNHHNLSPVNESDQSIIKDEGYRQ